MSKKILVAIALTAVNLGVAAQQKSGKADACQWAAVLAAHAYGVAQTLNTEFPDDRQKNLDDLVESIYQDFKKKAAKNGPEGDGFRADHYELERSWKERGARDYFKYPDIGKSAYERTTYTNCVNKN